MSADGIWSAARPYVNRALSAYLDESGERLTHVAIYAREDLRAAGGGWTS